MRNSIIQHQTQLEQDLLALHTGNSQTKQWFYQSILSVLEIRTMSSFAKCDAISEAFASLDSKIDYIKEQQKLLVSLKKQLELAQAYGKEEVSKALLSLGVSKLEGLKVSSITVSKAKDISVSKLVIEDEESLIEEGYFNVVLDKEAIERDLLSADNRHQVEKYVNMKIEMQHKPATMRINKRKTISQNETSLAA